MRLPVDAVGDKSSLEWVSTSNETARALQRNRLVMPVRQEPGMSRTHYRRQEHVRYIITIFRAQQFTMRAAMRNNAFIVDL